MLFHPHNAVIPTCPESIPDASAEQRTCGNDEEWRGHNYISTLLKITAAAVIILFLLNFGFSQELTGGCEVYITSTPAGAEVSVDGNTTGMKTPCIVKGLNPGAHIFKLETGDYSAEKKIILQEGVLGRHEIKLALKPVKLNIRSIPANSNVILNNRQIGGTPLSTTLENTGRYSLRLEAEGYIPKDTLLHLSERREYSFTFELEAAGFVHIESAPAGADAFIDKVYFGSTPIDTQLTKGGHTLQLMKGDYHIFYQDFSLSPGERQEIHAELKKLHGYLTVKNAPPNTEIYLNGKFLALSPLEKYELDVGEYSFSYRHPDYEKPDKNIPIVITQERVSEVKLRMRRKTMARSVSRSVVFPGLGQNYLDRKTKAYLFAAGEIILLAGTTVSAALFNEAVKDYNEARGEYMKQIEPNSIASAREIMYDRYKNVDTYDSQVKAFSYMAGGLWALNIVDVILTKNQSYKGLRLQGGFSADADLLGYSITIGW
ncbi:PEGA domain-containing protein [bacterium]|nr:PEGA domain-containing protein [bacterium]